MTTPSIFVPEPHEAGLGFLEGTLDKVLESREARERIKEAQKRQILPRGPAASLVRQALDKSVITQREAELLRSAETSRDAAVQVDAFAPDKLSAVQR